MVISHIAVLEKNVNLVLNFEEVIMKILIIEDDEGIRISLRYLMQRRGHEVTCLPDIEKGVIAMMEKYGPDLVITDNNLTPGNNDDGFHIAMIVKSLGKNVILMSGKSEIERLAVAENIPFLLKPFDPNDLFSLVNRFGNAQNADV